mmetsp:Transcript_27623/g.64773  ORF Transcript_27623/g.64773 Transcript_27623/m.64773 type:complete len:189 (+) Transcript_27623:1078-1644(+)
MSDLAPLVLSVLRDKTVVDLKAENDNLSGEVAKLQAERDDFLRYAIKHGRIEITDTKSKKVLARGLPPTMRKYADGFCTVGLMISDELVGGIEAASEIDIRLNGMVIGTTKELPQLCQWQHHGQTEIYKQHRYAFTPEEHKVKPWHSHELSLYAVEKDGPNNDKRVMFNAIALRYVEDNTLPLMPAGA